MVVEISSVLFTAPPVRRSQGRQREDHIMATGTGPARHGRKGGFFYHICTVLVVVLTAGAAYAAPPYIDFQGRVLGGDGQPHPGPVDIEVGVFDATSGGSELYHESHLATPLVDGVYSILLGGGASPPRDV